MSNLKVYIAFYKDGLNNITCLVTDAYTKSDISHDMRRNGFKHIIQIYNIDECKHIKDTDYFHLMQEMKWSKNIDLMVEYIKECWSIILYRYNNYYKYNQN